MKPVKEDKKTRPDVEKRAEDLLKDLRQEKYTVQDVKQLAYKLNKLAAARARV